MNIIQTENLSKRYGDTLAVDKVSLHVQQGDIYGFLGLNGAGKTTMIRLLLGLARPNSGTCTLFDQLPKQSSRLWNEVGYLIETPQAYPNLTVTENLEVIRKLRGLPDKAAIGEIIDRLRLTPYRHKKTKHLSLGNKQRLGLAKALMHKPKLLILDEPVNGLDPAGIVEVRALLKELNTQHGTTLFLSSHILSEIAKLVTHIGVIHQGALISELRSSDLQRVVQKKLHVHTPDNDKAIMVLAEHGFDAQLEQNQIVLSNPDAIRHPERLASLLVQNNLPPKSLFVHEEDLEGYFLRLLIERKA